MASESDQPDELQSLAMEEKIDIEDLTLVVERKVQHKDFTIRTHSLDYMSERIGLDGDHALLTITIFNTIKEVEEALSFFVKLIPKGESLAGGMQEEFSYGLFKEFEKVGISLIHQCVPRCLLVRPSSYLVLENLQLGSYALLDKAQLLTYEQVTAVLQSLAKLHASSLIYEETLSTSLSANRNEDIFRDRLFSDSASLDSSLKCILTEIELFQLPAELKGGKPAAEAIKELLSKLTQMVEPSGKFRKVFCHGDLWAANFLLQPGNPTQCKFVNFQMCRYLPPAHDVMGLLFRNTSREFRKNHLYELVGIYYSYMEKILKIFDYKLTELISFSDFLDSCEEQKLVAVLITALMLPLVLSQGEKFSEGQFKEDRSHLVLDLVEDEAILSRLRESIEDLLEECDKVR
ncbi:uncharacterized protein LOC109539858 [Dendroctonus ponderosae]|uniref:CHK kinase-like domain-containing protein n=1 Tax=Dendroctonus ponderosae TaxID=77166 RepID=A0AAR5PRA0_DENPD|nr:uncharacterized protein LOC109539858 [Dendroctonus ponderosae]KAH1013258.1 hypothetical protein HUJ04_002270 [Dendroctonus ponderosae]KAH1024853.1 hypothetical protein HUJ05_004282 [Dendroctonus ponderosae]